MSENGLRERWGGGRLVSRWRSGFVRFVEDVYSLIARSAAIASASVIASMPSPIGKDSLPACTTSLRVTCRSAQPRWKPRDSLGALDRLISMAQRSCDGSSSTTSISAPADVR